jgi:hypothetical protein
VLVAASNAPLFASAIEMLSRGGRRGRRLRISLRGYGPNAQGDHRRWRGERSPHLTAGTAESAAAMPPSR